jgi:hypothetical protein
MLKVDGNGVGDGEGDGEGGGTTLIELVNTRYASISAP